MKTISISLLFIATLVMLAIFLMFQGPQQADSAGDFAVAQQIASTTVLGPQGAGVVKNRIFAENLGCKSRVITTPGTSAIMLSFDDISYPVAGTTTPGQVVGSTTISASIGFLQAASTTKEYDAAIYGCGVWNGWAWASTTITHAEF